MEFKNILKQLTKNFFIGVLLVVLGFSMLIAPEYCKLFIILILGIEAVVNGIYSMVVTRKIITDSFFQYSMIFKGMLSIVIGLLAIFLSLFVKKVEIAMIVTLAIYFIIETIIQMVASGKLTEEPDFKKKFVFEAVICAIVAIALFIILVNVFIYIAGAVMILIGAFLIFVEIKNRPIVAEKVEIVDDISGTIE